MDVACNWFGVAAAAKVPVKRYNLLVPALYPVKEPDLDKTLGITEEKNFKKVAEYLERNVHRVPKVIRELHSIHCLHSIHDLPEPVTPRP